MPEIAVGKECIFYQNALLFQGKDTNSLNPNLKYYAYDGG